LKNTKIVFAVWYGLIAIVIGSFSFATAAETTLITPDLGVCPDGQFLTGFTFSGGLLCESPPVVNSNGEPVPNEPTNFTAEEEAKLKLFADKMTINDIYFYLDTRFAGFGEDLRSSGSQFQLYCDKISQQEGALAQNCTFYQVSEDGKTSAWIMAKDYDGVWVKVGAITEATNHEDIQFIMYGDNGVKQDGKANLVMTLKEDGVYVQKGYVAGMCKLTPQPDGSVKCI